MGREPTVRMKTEKLEMGNGCFDCPMMKEVVSRGDNFFDSNKGNIRNACAYCPYILKADMIYRYVKSHTEIKSNRNVGKKTTSIKRYGKAIKNLREQGKTLEEIASTLGISYNTVRKVNNANKLL